MLTTREAIDAAQDYNKAAKLASFMIFELGEAWHWPLCSRKLGIPAKVCGFVYPLGATMCMNGTALFEGITVIFLCQVFGEADIAHDTGDGTDDLRRLDAPHRLDGPAGIRGHQRAPGAKSPRAAWISSEVMKPKRALYHASDRRKSATFSTT